MPIRHETDLYGPVKAFFEAKGYEVRGEVRDCDLVAMKEDGETLIVELKKTFNLPLLVQGLNRKRHSSLVYLAVEKNANGRAPHGLKWSDLRRLCEALGLGLLTVRFYQRKKPAVEAVCEPQMAAAGQQARKPGVKALRLITEFKERSGDYNVGGSTRRKLVTAYREKALHCARLLKQNGPMATRALRELTGNPKTTLLLQHNYYLWFRRASRGVYELTPAGEAALVEFAAVLENLIDK